MAEEPKTSCKVHHSAVGNDVVQLHRGCSSSSPQAPFRVLLGLPHFERAGADRLRHLGVHGPSQGPAAEDPPQFLAHHPDNFRPQSCQLGLCSDCRPSWETEAERGVSSITLLAGVTRPSLCSALLYATSRKIGRSWEEETLEVRADGGSVPEQEPDWHLPLTPN